MLLAIRNALCRTRSSRAFTRKPPRLTRLSTQGESYRAPFHPGVAPRRLVKDTPRFHSSYAVLHPCLSTTGVHDHRYVWPTSAIPHFKNEHPMFRVTTKSLPELPPTRSSGPNGSRRVARFGRRHSISSPLAEHCPLAAGRMRPSPLTPPSPPDLRRRMAGFLRTTKTASAGAVRDWHQLHRPECVFLWRGALLELFTGPPTGASPIRVPFSVVPSLVAVLPAPS